MPRERKRWRLRSQTNGRRCIEPRPTAVNAAEGRLFLRDDRSRGDRYQEILLRNGLAAVEAVETVAPGDEQHHYSMHAFGSVFAEVAVDPEFGLIRVRRLWVPMVPVASSIPG